MKVIIGKLNTSRTSQYWRIGDEIVKSFCKEDCKELIGNYAIVENLSDYDLVRIIGIAEIADEREVLVMGNKINKKVINIVAESYVTGELND